jgi:hypothetical protein
LLQQKPSWLQIFATQGEHIGESAAPVVHSLCEQVPHGPQSFGHVWHVSFASQMPLPHWLPHVCPQTLGTRLVHWSVHAWVQHEGWMLQMLDVHGEHAVESGAPGEHTLCEQLGAPPTPPDAPTPAVPPLPPMLPPMPPVPPPAP